MIKVRDYKKVKTDIKDHYIFSLEGIIIYDVFPDSFSQYVGDIPFLEIFSIHLELDEGNDTIKVIKSKIEF